MLYLDTTYIVRLYTRDAGWEKVRSLSSTGEICCSSHGQAETVAAFHRKFREGAIDQSDLRQLIGEFERDCKGGAFAWLPVGPSVLERVVATYATLPNTSYLRAADAIHLSCAAENDCKEVYSNDSRLLAAANYFGVKGMNVI